MKAKREHQLFQQHRKAAVEARKEIKTVRSCGAHCL